MKIEDIEKSLRGTAYVPEKGNWAVRYGEKLLAVARAAKDLQEHNKEEISEMGFIRYQQCNEELEKALEDLEK